MDGLWFTHLSLIYSLLLSLIGLNTEQVYISWLCETLSCLRGQTRETTTEEKKSTFFRRLCLNAFWLRSSICASVFRNLLSDVPFDLWPGRNITQEGETEPEEDFNQISVCGRRGGVCLLIQPHICFWRVHSQVLNVVIDSSDSLKRKKKERQRNQDKLQLRK